MRIDRYTTELITRAKTRWRHGAKASGWRRRKPLLVRLRLKGHKATTLSSWNLESRLLMKGCCRRHALLTLFLLANSILLGLPSIRRLVWVTPEAHSIRLTWFVLGTYIAMYKILVLALATNVTRIENVIR